jgi:hypothetical protein
MEFDSGHIVLTKAFSRQFDQVIGKSKTWSTAYDSDFPVRCAWDKNRSSPCRLDDERPLGHLLLQRFAHLIVKL